MLLILPEIGAGAGHLDFYARLYEEVPHAEYHG